MIGDGQLCYYVDDCLLMLKDNVILTFATLMLTMPIVGNGGIPIASCVGARYISFG